MTSKKTKKQQKPQQMDWKQTNWVLNNLTDQELQDLDDNPPTQDEVYSWMARMIEKGWKVSIKWDYENACHLMTLVNLEKGNDEGGFAFSSRSDDVADCIAICWYKYVRVANGNISQYGVSVDRIRG